MRVVFYFPGKTPEETVQLAEKIGEACHRLWPDENFDIGKLGFVFQGGFMLFCGAEDDQGVIQELAMARVTRLWHENQRRTISVGKWSGETALNGARNMARVMQKAHPADETWFEYLTELTDTSRVFRRERIDGRS